MEPGPAIPEALVRRCLGLVATLEPDALAEQVLDALAQATGAQGAALWMGGEGGALRLAAHRGVVEARALPAALDPADPAVSASLRDGTPAPAPGWPAGEGLLVPLLAGDEVAGVALLARRTAGRFSAVEAGAAAAVGAFAGVALSNARRHQGALRQALRDGEGATYNGPYFLDHAAKELHKARRYGRQLSVAIVSVDNLEQARSSAPREVLGAGTRALAAALSRAAREADVVSRVEDGVFQVLLPETDHFGARTFLRRAAEELAADAAVQALERAVPLLLSLGIATYPRDGADLDGLLARCRARVDEERGSLVRRLHLGDLAPGAFWDLVDLLLSEDARLPESSPSARRRADPRLFEAVQREAARELGRDRRARGVVYLSAPGAQPPLLAELPADPGPSRAGDDPARVILLGPRASAPRADHPLVTAVPVEGDSRLAGHEFLLFLGECSSYALVQRPGGVLFHTCDAPLVDLLVAKLQCAYELQPI